MNFRLLVTAGCVLCGVGCGGAKPSTPRDPAAPTEAISSSTDQPAQTKTTVQTDVLKPGIPSIEENSAAAAVLRTLKALEAGNLAAAYDFLPPSYQADLDDLLHEFAGTMDAELWSRLTGIARKAIAVLRSKKEFLLKLDLFRDRPEAEPYRQHWDSTLQLLATFVDDDAGDLSRLKQAAVRSLLPGKSAAGLPQLELIGQALGANLARQFAGVTVTPVRSDDAEQVVAIRGPKDEKPTEFVYVQHDGKWLPKSLVKHWDEGIKADRAWLAKLPQRIKAMKPRLLDALSQADEILDQLQSAEDQVQFEQAAGPAILALATAWPNLMSLVRQTMAGQEELPRVTISINRELTERELTKLVANVLKPLRESGSDYTLLANDGRTICRVARINDVRQLCQSLATHFSIPADDLQVDRDELTIKIELAP